MLGTGSTTAAQGASSPAVWLSCSDTNTNTHHPLAPKPANKHTKKHTQHTNTPTPTDAQACRKQSSLAGGSPARQRSSGRCGAAPERPSVGGRARACVCVCRSVCALQVCTYVRACVHAFTHACLCAVHAHVRHVHGTQCSAAHSLRRGGIACAREQIGRTEAAQ